MWAWMRDHGEIWYWVGGASLVMFVATLLVVPALIVRIPPDYFAHEHRPKGMWHGRHPVVRGLVLVVKNALGAICIAMGVLMLVLPGQGVLTLLVGFFLLDFPGKYRLERRVVSMPRVLKSINWLRARRGHVPLERGKPQRA
jgi:hypothetical protein